MERELSACLWGIEEAIYLCSDLETLDPDLACIIECDASDFAIGAILSQDFNARLHPVAFHSRKINKHEINYEIHDKELLAITSAFNEWWRYLKGARHKINVFTDYRGLEWLAQNKPLIAGKLDGLWSLMVLIFRSSTA